MSYILIFIAGTIFGIFVTTLLSTNKEYKITDAEVEAYLKHLKEHLKEQDKDQK